MAKDLMSTRNVDLRKVKDFRR